VNITVTLFQIGFDRFCALAVDVDQQSNLWTVTYDSRPALVRNLGLTGVVTPAEISQLKQPSRFAQGGQIFHVSLGLQDIEKAGFTRYRP